MQKHRDVLQQASRLAVAVALCIAAMLAVYALTGHFTNAVLLGALIGFVMAMGNFLSLSITVSNAMNRARRRRSWKFRRRALSARSFWSSFISCCFVQSCVTRWRPSCRCSLRRSASSSSTFSARIPRRHKRQRTVIPPHEWSENLLYHPVVRRHRHHTDDGLVVCCHAAALHSSGRAGQ